MGVNDSPAVPLEAARRVLLCFASSAPCERARDLGVVASAGGLAMLRPSAFMAGKSRIYRGVNQGDPPGAGGDFGAVNFRRQSPVKNQS